MHKVLGVEECAKRFQENQPTSRVFIFDGTFEESMDVSENLVNECNEFVLHGNLLFHLDKVAMLSY